MIEYPDVKALLDPLEGVSKVEDPAVYPDFVDPDFLHVSPIYYSDVSGLNPMPDGTPCVNAMGLRRGLLAFKIIAIGADPDGPGGSVLPNIVVEIVDPSEIDLSDIPRSTNPKLQLVQ